MNIVGRNRQGMHLFESLFYIFDKLQDEIKVTVSEVNKISFQGNFASDVIDNRELVLDVIKYFQAIFPQICNLDIVINKNIPVGAGLGGGSGNVASVIRNILMYFNIDIAINRLRKMLRSFGSDIPVMVDPRHSFVTGISKNIYAVSIPELHILLVNPKVNILTKEVFSAYRDQNRKFMSRKNTAMNSTNMQHYVDFLSAQNNSLQYTAIDLYPVIKDVLDELSAQNGCLLSRMSGSGSTCFGIFDSMDNLQLAKNNIQYVTDWFVA